MFPCSSDPKCKIKCGAHSQPQRYFNHTAVCCIGTLMDLLFRPDLQSPLRPENHAAPHVAPGALCRPCRQRTVICTSKRSNDETMRTNGRTRSKRAGIKEDLPFNEFPSASTKNDEHRKACLYVRMSWCDAEVLDLSRDLFRVGSDISGCDKCHSCIFLTEASTCRC